MPSFSFSQKNGWYNYGTISPNNLVLFVRGYTGPSSSLISYNPSTGSVWYDISQNNNNMNLIGSYSFTGIENAIGFTGSSNLTGGYVISGNLYDQLNLNSFNQTQEIWFKNVYFSNTGTQGVLVSELNSSTISSGFHDSQIEIVGNTGYISVWSFGVGSNKLALGSVSDQGWHCIGWRYSSTGLLSGFFDGNLVSSVVATREIPSIAYYTALAARESTSLGNGNFYSGLIGTYRIYNRALTNSELYQNYNYESQFYRNSIKVNIIAPSEPSAWYSDVLNKIGSAMTGTWSNKKLVLTQNNSNNYVGSDLLTTNYDVAFIWADAAFSNTSLGTNLQNFVINGGGLVICVFASASVRLPTTFDYAYTPCVYPGNQTMSSTGLGTYDSSDPIMKGVTTFNPGTSKYGAGSLATQSGSTVVARYNDNNILVAKKVIGNAKTVTLNFFPPSSTARSDFWNATTDGAKLMANSIVWAGKAS